MRVFGVTWQAGKVKRDLRKMEEVEFFIKVFLKNWQNLTTSGWCYQLESFQRLQWWHLRSFSTDFAKDYSDFPPKQMKKKEENQNGGHQNFSKVGEICSINGENFDKTWLSLIPNLQQIRGDHLHPKNIARYPRMAWICPTKQLLKKSNSPFF